MSLIELDKESWFDNSYNSSYAVNLLRNFLNFRISESQNRLLIQTLEKSIDFINTHYVSQNSEPIQLYIIPSINIISNKGKTIDAGGTFYTSSAGRPEPYIEISSNYAFNIKNNEVLAQSMIADLGQEDFIKMMFYHEVGHYLDYLLSNNDLFNVSQNKLFLATGFLDKTDPLYKNFLKYWQSTFTSDMHKDEVLLDNHFKKVLRESAADCWSCVCLFKEKLQQGFNNSQGLYKIISSLIVAREKTHNNKIDSEYATYNALIRLYSNYKEYKPKTNQDWVNIIQDSIQEGLVLDAPEMPEFDIFAEMIEWLENKNINVEFLSTNNNIENIDLFKKHLENWLFTRKLFHKINYIVSSKDKKEYASKNTLLIDDSKECVNAFNKKGHTIYHSDIAKTIGAFKVYFPDFGLEKTFYKYQSLTHPSILSEILEEY